MALSSSMPPSLKFAQGFLPVFIFALVFWNWRESAPPLWLLAVLLLLLFVGSFLLFRVLWAVMRRADTIGDDDDDDA